ncbi:four helix bundle protein [Lacibacter luteus]|uniref:Four helix bundle protein n=1 Tax=Lacibacter luteus TaxID=2508719 RepID=A0A4Q1CET1_9BACT|nr:four helix bundle protein [Lacibacter luteus]RXK58384.1 four helix bundle protein [Lacibacter luteus]
MATIHKFEELEIWQLAKDLYETISPLSDKLKKNKDFRFAEQIKSSSGSIMDNIGEGFERSSRLEFINSLGISKGEAGELKSQLHRLNIDTYITEKEFQELYKKADTLCAKIAAFMSYLNTTAHKGLKFKDRQK